VPIQALKNLILDHRTLPGKKCVVFDIDDTLLSENSYPIMEVVKLLKFVRAHNYAVALVTARHISMRKFTILELNAIDIKETRDYLPEDLFFCPDSHRTSFVKISQWKNSSRKTMKHKYSSVFCTVGDQWTDLVEIKEEKERQNLDIAYFTSAYPYLLFKLYHDHAEYGLKLKSDPIIPPKFVVLKVGNESELTQSKLIFNQ
jgi:hypothetical protein